VPKIEMSMHSAAGDSWNRGSA